jgi:hypothetical protein
MSKFDEELESSLQGQEEETLEKETPVTEESKEEVQEQTSSPETVVTLLGRQYDLSKPDQVQELAKDYDRLGRQYAPLVQQLQELQARLEQLQQLHGSQVQQPQTGIQDPETVEYLRKLGFLSREELEQFKQAILQELNQRQEQERLEEYLTSLENEYDGSDGRPKFDRQKVLQFCVERGIADPEAGYKLLYEKELEEWRLKNLQKGSTPPPVVKGTSGATIPKPKKITLGTPESEDEIDLRTAIENTMNEITPKLSE